MTSSTLPALPGMMEAKFNISKVLDIPINSVERFKERTTGLLTQGLSGARRGGRTSPARAAGRRAAAAFEGGGGP